MCIMTEEKTSLHAEQRRSVRDLVNTPFKKVMFAVQILSYLLILGSPLIGGAVGRLMELSGKQTAAVIFGVFLAGEILFYGSLFFLGKELILLLKDMVRRWFRKRSGPTGQRS